MEFNPTADRSHGKAMERNVHLNWDVIARQARKRRKERGLTQQHLAALANVGRSTLNRFENQKGDVTLSSVLRILGVLDMLDRKQEGALRVKASETQSGAFDVTFTPNFGGDPRAAKTLASRKALEKFLSDLGAPEETQKRAIGEADSRGSGSIPRLQVSQTEVEENWPKVSR
jgi:transcriptional regulator with XRE-family HTH domain